MKKIDRTGETLSLKTGESITIVRYGNANNLDVQFSNGVVLKNKKYRDFENGSLFKFLKPDKVYGVGIYEDGVYKTRVEDVMTKEYMTWSNMLQRCYHPRNKDNTYKDCIVCEEWLHFQTFAKWYNENIWHEDATCLDKDILFKGNKLYSPKTCVLVDNNINILFVKSNKIRGKYPIGVSLDKGIKGNKKYVSKISINGKSVKLGRYETMEEAFQVYKKSKEEYIKNIALEYRNKYPRFPEKLYKAMCNYTVDIDD